MSAKRILFLAANPDETTRLDLELELRAVREALEKGSRRDALELRSEGGVRVSELQHLLDRERPDVVHFSGHGSAARGEIVLYDDQDQAYPVPIEPLAALLATVECVVLNACSSAAQAEAIARRGPVAIGMAGPIATSDAQCFSRTFYGKLADGCPLADAFEGARRQLELERRPGAPLPRLFGVAREAPAAPVAPAPADEPPEAPRAVELAIGEATSPLRVIAVLVTDEPAALAAEVASWRDRLARDPLLPAATRDRARKSDPLALFADPALRSRLFDWLSTTSFSLYAYYGAPEPLAALAPDEVERRLRVEPLLQRLRKKSERIAVVHARIAGADQVLAAALARLALEPRALPLPAPPTLAPASRTVDPLVALAEVAATVLARHLALPADEPAAIDYQCLATRLRMAKDVVTNAVHTRDKDPLP